MNRNITFSEGSSKPGSNRDSDASTRSDVSYLERRRSRNRASSLPSVFRRQSIKPLYPPPNYETQEERRTAPNIKKNEEVKNKERCTGILRFFQSFTTILLSPLFLRHRNIFFFCMELFLPALIALIIFAAFTSGLSWRRSHYDKVEASTRNLKFPHITMREATSAFRSLHVDSQNQALIFYTPVTQFTVAIMTKTLEMLEINENNYVFKRGQSSFGAVGVNDTLEMYERALYHRNERNSHGEPVAVVFHYNPKEISSVTNVPYNVTYSISVFDKSISETRNPFPSVLPVDSEKWKTPYLTSGFIGLQYAIEESVIRLILEKQQEVELHERLNNVKLKARSLESNGEDGDEDDEDAMLNSGDTDVDLLNFLIKKEIDERERMKPQEGQDSSSYKGRSFPGSGKGFGLSRSIRPITTEQDLPRKRLRTFSTDHHHEGSGGFTDLLSYVVTFTLVVAYSIMTFFIVKHIAEENLSGIKELLQIHGLPHYVHWTMLFFHALVFRTISSALIVLAFRIDYGNGRIAESVTTDVLFMLIYIHQLALTFFNYFIGCYITSVKMCGIIAVSLSALSFYVPETFTDMKLIGDLTDLLITVLFPNWAFRHAMFCLLDHEAADRRVEWSNIHEMDQNLHGSISIGDAMRTMGIMGIVYFFLAMYVDLTGGSRLFPYATTYKLNSFRDWVKKKRETWAQQKEAQRNQRLSEMGVDDDTSFPRPPIYEDPHPDKECFVRVRNLSKYYSSKHKVALDSLNINIMHEEITVFLGHSGCGKSTLISILAGMVKPSNGFATINGFDVSVNTKKARQFIGICPHKLVAFNLLTVREHIHLCYRLRGYPNKDCSQHAATILTQLKLWNVRTFLPGKLTKDELRRLGLAMAFVDAPKVLLLDEPTRGMDAIGRREVWDIIIALRHYHTIIVTTNYMDEAEHLADRLALIAHGRLVCFGSLDYLKSQYDTGYFLKLVPYSSEFIDANAVINFVRGILGENVHIKRHKRLKDVDTLELELPSNEKDNFADFCDELEKKKVDLHIMKYSIRQVHLNDIFIKICSSVAADGHAVDLYVRRDSAGDIKTVLTSAIPEIPEGTTKAVTRVNLTMCLVRRAWTVLYKGSYGMLMHFVIPLIVIWTIVFQAKLFVQARGENPEMALNTENFGSNQRILARVAQDDPSVVYAKNYSSHMSRVLYPFGEHLSREEPVIPKLYEVFHADPTNMGTTQDQHMVAFEFGKYANDYEIVGYFASGVLHSAPVALNVMNNIILSVVSEPERNITPNWRPYSVTPRNDPMPQVLESPYEYGCGIPCILLAVVMSFALAFIVHNACLLPMMEKENGMKHIILMCGVEPFIYWLSNFIVDLIVMLFISVIIVFIFLSDLYQTFYSKEVLTAVFLICALYLMWSGLMYVYYVSSILSSKINGYNFLAGIHLIFGIILAVWIIFSPPESGFGVFCRNLLLFLFPPYTITTAMYHFFSNSGQRNICRNINSFITTICDDSKHAHHHYTYSGHKSNQRNLYVDLDKIDPKFTRCCPRICKISGTCFKPPTVFNSSEETWENPGVVTDVCALIFQGFLYWGLLIIAERHLFARLGQNIALKYIKAQDRRVSPDKKETKIGREVQHEGRAVYAALKTDHWAEDLAMVCQSLTKSSSSAMIIKDFNLHVKKGQCIAILGRGDSGKSSIVKMMAGEMLPTKGNCFMQKINLRQNRKEYLSHIGYCPQRNCLFAEYTGAQMMRLIGRLRGVPSSIISTHINKWMNVMGLSEVANDPCKEYGDGMRQRLRTAMSLIGEPDIIILDEPTTGVDPSARERLWCVLEHLNQKGFTVVFTTYSTDEAFSLAEKVVVLSEGTVQIIGDPETIQKTYARGHIITFTLRHDVISSIEMVSITDKRIVEFKEHVNQLFQHIDLLDEHDETIMYFLRDVRLSWAEVFRRGHYLATVHDYIISSYEVTEGGVDDIFVFLANKYHELNEPKSGLSPETNPNQSVKEIDEFRELRKSQERYKYSQYNV